MTQKIENKLTNFKNAEKRLKEAVTAYKNNSDNSLYRDALIQRFEFTYELAWKTLSATLRDQGIFSEIDSPKMVLKTAYSVGYLDDESVWIEIREARNKMSHNYEEKEAIEIAEQICNRYAKAMGNLVKRLSAQE